jgi:hypothetical protein
MVIVLVKASGKKLAAHLSLFPNARQSTSRAALMLWRKFSAPGNLNSLTLQLNPAKSADSLQFFWLMGNLREGRDYPIEVRARADSRAEKEQYGELANRVARTDHWRAGDNG